MFALGVGGVYFGGRQEGHAEAIRTICWASSLMTFGILTAFLVRGEVHLTDPAWRLGHEGVENQVGWVASVGLLLAWVTRGRSDIWTSKPMLRFQLTVTGLGVLLSKSRETWLGVLAGLVAMQLMNSAKTVLKAFCDSGQVPLARRQLFVEFERLAPLAALFQFLGLPQELLNGNRANRIAGRGLEVAWEAAHPENENSHDRTAAQHLLEFQGAPPEGYPRNPFGA